MKKRSCRASPLHESGYRIRPVRSWPWLPQTRQRLHLRVGIRARQPVLLLALPCHGAQAPITYSQKLLIFDRLREGITITLNAVVARNRLPVLVKNADLKQSCPGVRTTPGIACDQKGRGPEGRFAAASLACALFLRRLSSSERTMRTIAIQRALKPYDRDAAAVKVDLIESIFSSFGFRPGRSGPFMPPEEGRQGRRRIRLRTATSWRT